MNREQKVNKRKEIIKKSEELHKAIIKIGIKKGVFSKNITEQEIQNRYVDIFDVLPDNIASSVLVLSINPSSSDIDKGETPSPCYLHYIPQEIKLLRPDLAKDAIEKWNGGKKGKRFCYPGYFGRIYKLFEETDYYPLYVSSQFNENWIKIVESQSFDTDLLTPKDKEALKVLENDTKKKYIIITDLIPVKETDSKNILKIIDDENIKKLIIELLKLKIQFLNPKYTLLLFKGVQKDLLSLIDELFESVGLNENNSAKSGFIRYMKEEKLMELKNKMNLGIQYSNLSDKWDYIKHK